MKVMGTAAVNLWKPTCRPSRKPETSGEFRDRPQLRIRNESHDKGTIGLFLRFRNRPPASKHGRTQAYGTDTDVPTFGLAALLLNRNTYDSESPNHITQIPTKVFSMKRVDSVISLIYSLSKSEKKHFSLQVIKDKTDKDYLTIYDIITKSKLPDGNKVKEEFYRHKPNGSFEVSIQYLYEKLTDTLLALRKKKDFHYDLLNDLCKARMLYERSLFEECFEILSDTIEKARLYENNEILVIAQKLELEYLLRLNFPNMTEQELFHKHFIQNEALKKIRKITEQSSLHNLLKYRLSHIGAIRTEKQRQDMNDLMINELYIAASSDTEGNFELARNHKLFQANYLMGTGDYKAALNSYKELNTLFEQNRRFWSNPPIYYLSVLEGVLGSLRSTAHYDEMPYFLLKLKELIAETPSLEFKVNATCLLFQYELFPHLDKGYFTECTELMNRYKATALRQGELAEPHTQKRTAPLHGPRTFREPELQNGEEIHQQYHH